MKVDHATWRRFWSKTKKVGACVLWIGPAGKNGYGTFNVSTGPKGARRGLTVSAHRFLYTQVLGPLPSRVDVMHSCDERRCVALQHLSPGTRQQNMADAANKSRMPAGERSCQAKLTELQVAEIRRRCRAGEAQARVAIDFGVHQVTVSKIVRGLRWK